MGSNITFKIAPATIDVIANFGLPSALIIEFKVVPIIMKGNLLQLFHHMIKHILLVHLYIQTMFNSCGKNISVATPKINSYYN